MKYLLSSERRCFFFLVFLPFIVWLLCLWSYFSAKMTLVQDAVSYYEHIGFFTDNLMHGVFPLWHPDWVEGAVPYNFFLRRIGDCNPVFWIIVLLKAVGIKQVFAHLVFLALYFFAGTVAFWLIARMLFRDKIMAASAYLLLLFSSWGGQLFFTYIVILFTPILWFFYFLLAFGKDGKKHQFLGVCFSLGILSITYIPFFFLTILFVFLFTFPIFFWQNTLGFLRQIISFIKSSRVFFAAGIIFILLACLPAINFYHESKQGEFTLPGRHAGASESSTLTVSKQLAVHGDLVTQGYFENIFESHSSITVESFFISFFIFIVLILSVINPMTRRGLFLLTTMVVLTAISVTESTPVYKFIYDHVFFFKFMRNIYYIFWLGILPLFILFGVEQLQVFIHEHQGKKNFKILSFVIVMHLAFAGWLLFRENILWTTWVTLGTSLIYFLSVIKGLHNNRLMVLILFISIVIQPAHILQTMAMNGTPFYNGLPEYDKDHFKTFGFQRELSSQIANDNEKEDYLQEMQKGIYYANRWYADIKIYVPDSQLVEFMHNRLYLADNTTIYDDNSPQFCRKLGNLWQSKSNVVFLAPDKVTPGDVRSSATSSHSLEPITSQSTSIKVLSFDVNTLKIRTNLAAARFLVWTDSYDSNWHVYINGKEGRVLRVFHAFKGVWIPEGSNTIVFRYAGLMRYLANYMLMTIFIVMFFSILILSRREGFLTTAKVTHE